MITTLVVIAALALLAWLICAALKPFAKLHDGVEEGAVAYPLVTHSVSPVFGATTSGFSTQRHRFACDSRYRTAARRSLPSSLYDEIAWDDFSDDLPPLFELIGDLIVGPDYYTYSQDGVFYGVANQDEIDTYNQSPSYDAGDDTDNSGNTYNVFADPNITPDQLAAANAEWSERAAEIQAQQDNSQQAPDTSSYQTPDPAPVYVQPDPTPVYERPDTSSTYSAPDTSSTYSAPDTSSSYDSSSSSSSDSSGGSYDS